MIPGIVVGKVHSWSAVSRAIADLRPLVAEKFGVTTSTVEFWCAPRKTRQQPDNWGRPSPVDKFLLLVDNCRHPDILQRFCADHWKLHLLDLASRPGVEQAADALGFRLVPKIDTPDDSRIVLAPAVVAEMVDALLRELNRRKPKMTAQGVRDLQAVVIRRLTALVADRLAKRAASTSP